MQQFRLEEALKANTFIKAALTSVLDCNSVTGLGAGGLRAAPRMVGEQPVEALPQCLTTLTVKNKHFLLPSLISTPSDNRT